MGKREREKKGKLAKYSVKSLISEFTRRRGGEGGTDRSSKYLVCS